MSDYLWDGSGEPDSEIVRLEEALRPLRRLPPPPEVRGAATAAVDWRALAAAAAAVVALASALVPRPAAGRGWNLVWLADGRAAAGQRLHEGEWLDTGVRRARLEVGTIGEVRLERGTRVAIVDAGRAAHRLSLERGTVHATIWAPPGRFVVDTPAAVAIDLGCQYTLEVEADGSGVLRVEAGWVGFELGGVQSLVPAGASCRTRHGHGPGTPRFDTASLAFATALDALDAGAGDAGSRRRAVAVVLDEARPRDAFTLWHLLARVTPSERGRVFDRLADLVPPPPGVTREGILSGDRQMREAWWDELGLGSSEFWRLWTRRDLGAP